MTDDQLATTPHDGPEGGEPPAGPPRNAVLVVSRRKAAAWTAIAVAVIAVAVGSALFFTRDAKPLTGTKEPSTIKGTLQVFGACGSGGYSDLREGAQIKLTDSSETVLGIATLRSTGTYCAFDFVFVDPPTDKTMYGVKLGTARGVYYLSKEEAFSNGFEVSVGEP